MTQASLPFHYQPSYHPQDFLVSAANEQAYQSLTNPEIEWHNGTLILWGESGCGKTHLAHIFAQHHPAKFLDASSLETALSSSPSTPINWVFEDVDTHLDKTLEPELLFHALNHCMLHHTKLLLTATTPPARWTITLKDLASRLLAASCIAVQLPDDTLMRSVLTKLFSDRQLHIQEGVVDYILPRIERHFGALHTIVDLLDHASMREKKNITTRLARDILAQLPSRY